MNDIGPRRIPWDDYLAMHLREIVLAAVVILALVAAWLFVGNPGGTELTGTVTSAGKTVTYGTVTVVASDGRVFTAPIGPDGTYRIRAVPAGPVRVAVSSPNPRSVVEQMGDAVAGGVAAAQLPPAGAEGSGAATAGGPGSSSAAKAAGRGGQPSGGRSANEPEQVSVAAPSPAAVPYPVPAAASARQEGWFRIPGRYASPATSGIRGDVKRGRTPLDLKLD